MGSGVAGVILRRLGAGVILALGLGGAAFAACQPGVVDLKGKGSTARFSVEIADTDETRAYGLMNRPFMPKSAGMLFIYDRPGPASFWMKNTLIPLDMLFIDEHGVVKAIHENAIPGDLTPIYGGEGIKAVLEINGGLARKMRIAAGDHIRHPTFSSTSPVWPCD